MFDTTPNGSIASASFAGKTAALTLADFGLPTAYLGAFQAGDISTWNASVTTAAGKTASATASANIMAGGLNVTITPAKAVVEPTLNNRRRWMQTVGANQTSVIIDVKDSNNQPVTNAQFTVLGVETVPGAETYGGHDHATDPNNVLTKPTGTWGGNQQPWQWAIFKHIHGIHVCF